jgi:hypothetical protein
MLGYDVPTLTAAKLKNVGKATSNAAMNAIDVTVGGVLREGACPSILSSSQRTYTTSTNALIRFARAVGLIGFVVAI